MGRAEDLKSAWTSDSTSETQEGEKGTRREKKERGEMKQKLGEGGKWERDERALLIGLI